MSVIEEIREYAELHSRGVLTDDEFTRLKNVAINKNTTGKSDNVVLIENPDTIQNKSEPIDKSEWMISSGLIIIILSMVAFFASCETNKKIHEPFAGILAGILNPVFFLCFPLGLFWLTKSGAFSRLLSTESGRFSIPASLFFGLPALAYYFGFIR